MSEARARPSQLGGKDIYLARHRTSPYQRVYRPALPQRQDIPGDPLGVSSDPNVRYWRIDDWSGGQGNPVWRADEANVYDIGFGCGPTMGTNRDLILAPYRETATGGAGATEHYIAVVNAGLYAFSDDNKFYEWSTGTHQFGAGVGMGTVGIESIVGVADPGDADFYMGWQDSIGQSGLIRQFDSASNSAQYDTAGSDDFTQIKGLTAFKGVLYALDQADLYTIDLTTTNTRTKVVDVADNYNGAGTDEWGTYLMTTSDVGPCWLQQNRSGQIFIHQYNHFSDTHSVEGVLPTVAFDVISLAFYAGFYFVPYKVHASSQEFFLFYAQGAQQGSIGPFEQDTSVSRGTRPIVIGSYGDEILICASHYLWSYDLRAGAMIARTRISGGVAGMTELKGAAMLAGEILISGYDNTPTLDVDFIDLDRYNTSTTGQLETGRYDFDYPGIDKILLDATVITEPLPANTTVDLDYSVEGGSYTSLTGTHSTDNDTSYTWTISTNSSSVTGKEFEFRIKLASSNSSNTPTIRALIIRATSAVKTLEWRLELDTGTGSGGVEGARLRSDLTLADLKTVAETNAVVQFTDNWYGDEYDSGTSYDVVVMDVVTPEWGTETPTAPFAQVRLRAVDFV